MTNAEFSHGFDTLLNSYGSVAQFGEEASMREVTLDEYEKSLFLTQAQEKVVLSLYNGKNPYGESFEGTEEMRRYLSSLVSEKYLKPITNSGGMQLGISMNSSFFTLPEDLWFITMEYVMTSKGRCGMTQIKVCPVRQDEYLSIKDNPFRGANDRRALRLDLSDGNVEVICKYIISVYYVRYLRKLSPIILSDLPDGLTIGGKGEATGCELHEALHQEILDMAVRMALQSRGYNLAGKQQS